MSAPERVLFNSRERDIADDKNNQQIFGEADLMNVIMGMLSDATRVPQQGVLYGLAATVTHSSDPVGITIAPGALLQYDASGTLGSQSAYRLGRLDTADDRIAVLTSDYTNKYYLIQGQHIQITTDEQSRDVYDPVSGTFTPTNVYKRVRPGLTLNVKTGDNVAPPLPDAGFVPLWQVHLSWISPSVPPTILLKDARPFLAPKVINSPTYATADEKPQADIWNRLSFGLWVSQFVGAAKYGQIEPFATLPGLQFINPWGYYLTDVLGESAVPLAGFGWSGTGPYAPRAFVSDSDGVAFWDVSSELGASRWMSMYDEGGSPAARVDALQSAFKCYVDSAYGGLTVWKKSTGLKVGGFQVTAVDSDEYGLGATEIMTGSVLNGNIAAFAPVNFVAVGGVIKAVLCNPSTIVKLTGTGAIWIPALADGVALNAVTAENQTVLVCKIGKVPVLVNDGDETAAIGNRIFIPETGGDPGVFVSTAPISSAVLVFMTNGVLLKLISTLDTGKYLYWADFRPSNNSSAYITAP